MIPNLRIVRSEEIENKVNELFISANYFLPGNLSKKIAECKEKETNELASTVLQRLTDNIEAAKEINVPVCQDTGMAVLFVEIGKEVYVDGDTVEEAINRGVRAAYLEGYLRCSVVKDPFYSRVNTKDNTPAIIYLNTVKGDKIKITALPKGFGSENMSAVKMFTPAASEEDIIGFVVDTVKKAGSNPCPPIVVGMGIGGTFDYCAVLSKKALSREIDDSNPDANYAALEQKILERINELDIGPQGFGGKTTALAVKINQAPTHIAGLPVAVNICCHVARHAHCEI